MTLSADAQGFLTDHRAHEDAHGRRRELTLHGYRLEIACPCGVVFERWITPREAAEDRALGFCLLASARHAGDHRLQGVDVDVACIGDIVTGMERQGYALALRKLVDAGWNAAWKQHRLLAPVATANAPTPFRAVVDAAWKALNAKPMPTPGQEMVEELL